MTNNKPYYRVSLVFKSIQVFFKMTPQKKIEKLLKVFFKQISNSWDFYQSQSPGAESFRVNHPWHKT